jgi:glutaminyl-peptide cyclotransferase
MTSHGLTHEGHYVHKDHKGFVVFGVLVACVTIAVGCLSAQPARSTGPKFESNRAYEDLRQQVAFGPRPAGSPALQKTRDYIKAQLAAAGLKPEEQPFDAQTPAGTIHMVNIRATLPGRSSAHGRIVVGGHYDTKLSHDFPFVGASDAASSAAFLLEIARDLKGRANPFPIELLFLDGEEAVNWNWDDKGTDHTYGSRYYVQQAKQAGKTSDIRAFILIDMIGDRDLDIRRESYSTKWLTNAVWDAAKRLKRPEFLDEPTPIEDDHLEFLAEHIDSVDIIDLDDTAWHTAADNLSHVSARSLQAVGDVFLAALPSIEGHLRIANP